MAITVLLSLDEARLTDKMSTHEGDSEIIVFTVIAVQLCLVRVDLVVLHAAYRSQLLIYVGKTAMFSVFLAYSEFIDFEVTSLGLELLRMVQYFHIRVSKSAIYSLVSIQDVFTFC